MKRYGRIAGILLGGALLFAVSFGLAGCRQEEPEGITGSFYRLQNAYDEGLLTQNDLLSIAYYRNGGRTYNENVMSVDFIPIPKNPEVLDEKIDRAICLTFLEKRGKGEEDLDKVLVLGYYGCYGEGIAVMVDYKESYAVGTYRSEYVEGICFYYHTNPNSILIWVKD